MSFIDYLEVKFWRLGIWLIKRGYGEPCDEFEPGCGCCQAGVTLRWIEKHIELIEL